MNLLSPGASNAKLRKNDGAGIDAESWILYLSPSDSSGSGDVCPAASPGCKIACLATAGRGAMNSVQAARRRKTALWFGAREQFLRELREDLGRLVRRSSRLGIQVAVRLNGTSDIAWEDYGIPHEFPMLQFYDYTKRPERAAHSLRASWPANYHLTFSRSEVNESIAKKLAARGVNVAVVFSGSLPPEWAGRRVVDGTLHDARWMDPRGVVVGLVALGRGRQDTSGFVVRMEGA